MLRNLFTFVLLASVRAAARLFWRHEVTWVGDVPGGDRWSGIRLVAILNHTSLYEPLLAGAVPLRFMWRIARHGIVPAADKTIARPIVGTFYRFVAPHVVPITRKADHTWATVLERVHDPQGMLIILPEGRMKRRNGLDSKGQPMTVRGGIADILRAIPEGPFLLCYSGGLHHIQAPGEPLPRFFRRIRTAFEVVDIGEYRDTLLASAGEEEFKGAVIADLERRRDTHCPPLEQRNRALYRD